MPWKMDDNKALVLDANGNPSYITDSGEEKPVDYPAMVKHLAGANSEAAERKAKIRELEKKFEPFKDIEDLDGWHKSALTALETVKGLPEKDKNTEDRIRAQVEAATKPLTEKLAQLEQAKKESETRLKQETIANAFVRSSFVKEKMVDPAIASDLFSKYFDIGEDGKIFATGMDGKTIFSDSGVADFDYAMSKLVETHSGKNYLLKGSDSKGTGAPPSNIPPGITVMTRAAFESLSPAQKIENVASGKYKITD
jgi:hypothetical protein